jgi:predicted ATP-grasp superfamily ATP-dependent carboligase
LNLLIFEYVSGGGYADQKLSASILSEGYGMLRSLISDCKAAGHNVITLLDSRLKAFNPPNEADKIVSTSSPHEFSAKLTELSGVADAVYIIAPESGQVLENLVENIEASGGKSLNCEADAIRQVSNKMTAYATIKKRGLKVPETVLLGIHEKTENIKRLTKELGYPLVFKPLDGVSCGSLSIARDEEDIAGSVKKIVQESMSKQFIAQKVVRGKAASACVISTGDKAVAVTLNRQLVTLASPDEESAYYGGAVPFDHSLEKEALRVAERAVEAVSGLKGYVGIDIILTNEGPVVLEVNPRLTTSYVGLRRVVNFNPAEAIVDAVIGRELPKNVQSRGYSFFSKVEVPPRPQTITETYKMEDVISPPFPIKGNKSAYALIATVSTSPKGAESAFYRTKKRLLNLYHGD